MTIDLNNLKPGMLIEAETAGTKPRTIQVRIDRTPWHINDRSTTLSDGRGVVAVFTDTIRIIPEPVGESAAMAPGQVFTGTPEEILAQVMQANERRITAFTAFIAFRLPHLDWQLAEDLAQEVFLHLWRFQITRGIVLDDRVYGLLCCSARQILCQHYRPQRNHEKAVDFTDPAIRPVTAAPQDTPHLARLYDELEAAKDALVPLAETYRVTRRQIRDARSALRFSSLPATVERWTACLAELAETERITVDAFKAAADLVAERRQAWNEAATTLGNSTGDSDPDMDEALRRVRVGAGR